GRVLAVQGDAVEGGGQARGRLAQAQVVEAAVGALGRALAREHADRVLAGAAVRVDAAGVRVVPRQVLLLQEGQQLAPALVGGRGDLRDLQVAERLAVVVHADGLAADLVLVDLGGDGFEALRPLAQEPEGFAVEGLDGVVVALAEGEQAPVHLPCGSGGSRDRVRGFRPSHKEVLRFVQVERLRQLAVLELLQALPQGLGAVGDLGLGLDALVDGAALLGDLGQVADAAAGDQDGGTRLLERGVDLGLPVHPELLAQQAAQVREHPGDAGVVELAGDGRVDRHVLVGDLELHVVALPLLAHVAQRVLGAALVELVEHDELGEVEHVDLLELARGAEVAGHDVHREVDQVHDLRVALADAGGLDDHQVVAQRLEEADAVLQHHVGGGVLAAGGHGAHENALAAQRVHADAVAQQRAAGAAAGRVHRDHGDAHLREVGQEAVEQLVGHRALAGAAGTGDADHRGLAAGELPLLAQPGHLAVVERSLLDRREHLADLGLVGQLHLVRRLDRLPGLLGAPDHVLDHRHQPHVHAVIGVVDALDAVGLELPDLLRGDGAAATGEHLDVPGAALAQHVHHVLEVLDVAALVAGQGDAVGVLLQRGADHVLDRAVVAEVDDFRALGLDQAAHDVDRGVVAVEQAGGGDEAQRRGGVLLRRGGGGLAGCGIHAAIVSPRAGRARRAALGCGAAPSGAGTDLTRGPRMPQSTTLRLALACLLPLAATACATPPADAPQPPIVEPSPRLVLLGEVHDNAAGHRQRLEAVRGYTGSAGFPVVIAMEQFDRERQADLDAAMGRCVDAACVIEAAAPAKAGWNWDFYAPVIQHALDHDIPLVAANLSRADASKVVKEGFDALPEDLRDAFDLDQPLPEALLSAQVEAVREGHCDMLPESLLEPMARAQ